MKTRLLPGLTLIEVLIVIGIVAALASIGIFVSMNLYHGYTLVSQRDQLVTLMQKARSQSLYNTNQASHGIYIAPTQFILFQGGSYLTRTPSYDEVVERDPVIIVSGHSEVVFEQLNAKLPTPVSITLAQDSRSMSIIINEEGAIIF